MDGIVYGEDLRALDDNVAFTGKTVAKKVTATGDPTLKVSYNPSTMEFTVERTQPKKSTGNLKLDIEVDYAFATWEWYGAWYRVNDRIGTTSDSINLKFTNFQEEPKLEVSPKTNIQVNLNSNLNAYPLKDFFDVTSNVGDVKAEYARKPVWNHVGKETATIHAWDEYGEGDTSDKDHHRNFDVTFNVVDLTNWENDDLRNWIIYPEDNYERVKDPRNSYTGDYAIYSTKSIAAQKQYHLEKGATYKFTTYIKPEVSTETDLILVSLQMGDKQRVFIDSSSTKLPSVNKGYKEISKEFTVGDGEENPALFFKFMTEKSGVYIDSFKLEKVK